jgi:hypothetical protein
MLVLVKWETILVDTNTIASEITVREIACIYQTIDGYSA